MDFNFRNMRPSLNGLEGKGSNPPESNSAQKAELIAPSAKSRFTENLTPVNNIFSPPSSESTKPSDSQRSSVTRAGIFGPGMKRLGGEAESRPELDLPAVSVLQRRKSAPPTFGKINPPPNDSKAKNSLTEKIKPNFKLLGKTSGLEIFKEAKKQTEGRPFNAIANELYGLKPKEAVLVLNALMARFVAKSNGQIDRSIAKNEAQKIFSDGEISANAKECFLRVLAAGSNAMQSAPQAQSNIEKSLNAIKSFQDNFRHIYQPR